MIQGHSWKCIAAVVQAAPVTFDRERTRNSCSFPKWQDGEDPGGGESDHHFSASNEKAAQEKGVKRVCVPNRNTRSAERKREQKKRWFREGQRWRTGCEGRISVVKRRHGLNRCRDKGERGMQRWVGFGVIANNLINIGRESQNNYGRN